MKKFLSLLLTLALLTTMCVFTSVSASAEATQWDGQAATSFSGGDGSKDNPYKIATAGELKLFANIVNGKDLTGSFTHDAAICGVLTADIVLNVGDVSGCGGNKADGWVDWFPIGYSENGATYPYTGTFDGAGYTVSGLYINIRDEGVGLFGAINAAAISNLGVINSCITGSGRVGGVCGYNKNGSITKCYNTSAVNGSSQTGGICGINSGGTITKCYNTNAVNGGRGTGGVCGDNYVGGKTIGCYNTGTVNGGDMTGGVCGTTSRNGETVGCYNTGKVSGREYVGGVCGINSGTINGNYNIGTVNGSQFLGGVCGLNNSGTITGCYYLTGTVAGGINGADVSGSAEMKTEAEMKTQAFTTLLNANGGDFILYIGYPVQSWQSDERTLALTYTIDPTYMVTIPSEVTLGGTATVKAENVVLEYGKQLEIALTATNDADNAFKVTNGGSGVLIYEVTKGSNPVSIGDTVLTVNPKTASTGTETLSVSKPIGTPQYSGDYSGTITFTVSVADE